MSSTPIKKPVVQHRPLASKKMIQADPSQASTPIKATSPSKAKAGAVAPQKPEHLLLLEHDTPIKGHKLKSLDSQVKMLTIIVNFS